MAEPKKKPDAAEVTQSAGMTRTERREMDKRKVTSTGCSPRRGVRTLGDVFHLAPRKDTPVYTHPQHCLRVPISPLPDFCLSTWCQVEPPLSAVPWWGLWKGSALDAGRKGILHPEDIKARIKPIKGLVRFSLLPHTGNCKQGQCFPAKYLLLV